MTRHHPSVARASRAARALVGSGVLLALACASPPPPPPGPPPVVFSGERAAEDVRVLPGSARAARERVREELEARGLAVGEIEVEVEAGEAGALTLHHLCVRIPGREALASRVLVVAPLARELGTEAGTGADVSGAALALELARALAERPLAAGVDIAFVDGEAMDPAGEGSDTAFLGSRSLVRALAGTDVLEAARLVLYVDRLGRASQPFARDRRSHRRSRDAFFETAADRGLGALFPRTASYREPAAGHLAFRQAGLRRVVLLGVAEQTTASEDSAPAASAGSGSAGPPTSAPRASDAPAEQPAAAASAERLAAAGAVVEDTLRRLTNWWAELDRIAGEASGATASSATRVAGDASPETDAGGGASAGAAGSGKARDTAASGHEPAGDPAPDPLGAPAGEGP